MRTPLTLAALLTAHARSAGITGGEIYRAVGDIDDYLAARRPAASGVRPARLSAT